jgi:hypothetical protein
MQTKAVKTVRDEDRYCVSCGYEGSPYGAKSDDLRFFGTSLYHPLCFEEINYLVDMFNEHNTPKEKMIEILQFMGIPQELVGFKESNV